MRTNLVLGRRFLRTRSEDGVVSPKILTLTTNDDDLGDFPEKEREAGADV